MAGIGWRYLLGTLAVSAPVRSLVQASEVAAAAVAASGQEADAYLRVDMRPDRVELSVQTRALGATTGRDTQLEHRIDAALAGLGLAPAGATSVGSPRPVQMLEMAIDAVDIPAIRPFWKAVLGYVDEPGSNGGQDAIVDPAGQLPAIWFQQMDTPRPQRNRVHFNITVAHDEAAPRVRAALTAIHPPRLPLCRARVSRAAGPLAKLARYLTAPGPVPCEAWRWSASCSLTARARSTVMPAATI